MLHHYCRACHLGNRVWEQPTKALPICQSCLDELNELTLKYPRPNLTTGTYITDVRSLFRYQGLVRELILRAKVKGDHQALKLIIAIAIREVENLSLSTWPDTIIASPSSLWGRCRGRLDIAAHLTAQLAKNSAVQVESAPWELYWRWQKLARQARKQRLSTLDYDAAFMLKCKKLLRITSPVWHEPRPKRILLVDDVITTGITMQRTAAALARDCPAIVRGLTVAAS
jgi:predicted amidophosphoribosyltransferase